MSEEKQPTAKEFEIVGSLDLQAPNQEQLDWLTGKKLLDLKGKTQNALWSLNPLLEQARLEGCSINIDLRKWRNGQIDIQVDLQHKLMS